MSYRIEYLASVVGEDIPKLAKTARKQIEAAIETKFVPHPIEFGKPLRYSLRGVRRLRVGDWRIIYYKIEAPDVVLVVNIGHRREIYER